ncbi:SEC14-like protein 2 isoform X1 [Homalodisca vitripennis]|uniref:SEC14-like protein 2 isoform X1 n=1 Tax=Homalodisca vitripennis TaxID=197043 RepID=UPI001EE9E747|nr:SEC14-like protein 2 isoform X1 [Homalodisca vitripennis]
MAPNKLNLNDDQLFSLMKLRRNVADVCTLPYHDDQFLLRWLRARNFDCAAAEKMLRESLKWRAEWDVDNLEEWEAPAVFEQYYPSGICGFDREGSPVIVLPFSGMDIWGMLHTVTKADLIKQTIRTVERHLALARSQASIHGHQASQLVAIIDMTDFNLRQYAWRPASELVIAMIQMYEANYPEILKACYIINVPKVFALAFSIVKNFLNDYTISKIQIFKAEPGKWGPALLRQIPAENLPQQYGGDMVDPDGDPRCPSKVPQGGKVPKSMYVRKSDRLASEGKDSYCSATVRKGEKLRLNYLAAQEGSFLKWGFYSDGHDIKFGVSSKDEEGRETVVVPVHRVECHKTEEVGTIECPTPATYTIIFDNSYSYLRNKKLHYSISITTPDSPDNSPEE